MFRTLLALLVLCCGPSALGLDETPAREPSASASGKVYAWKAADELPFEYYVPRSYDADAGANLTLVLHGNGLNERWTFWNHPAGKFRPDDIVVSPDGTTYHQGMKNDEFLGARRDADRLHAFLEELKETFNVKKVFLYGHSQGSFFVFYYAGEYPQDVDGVLGHASGVWNWSKQAKAGHHQAVALMHGTEDHIPYGQSWWGRKSYEEAGYEHVHLRTLWNWPHAPHQLQAAQVLAWVEAMVSDDPERVAVCLEDLSDPKIPMGLDWSALHEVAAKLAKMKGASAKHKKAATVALAAVEKAGQAQVEAITKLLGKKGKLHELPESASTAEFVGILLRLREEFRNTPVFQQFQKDRKKSLAALEKAEEKSLEEFWKHAESKPGKAFAAGLEALEKGFLSRQMPRVLGKMKAWADDAKTHGINKKDGETFRKLVAAYEKGVQKGGKSYESRNAKQRL